MTKSNEPPDAPPDEPDVAITRLEAALARIERGATPASVDTAAVAARLDRLILQLRTALDEANA